MPLEFPDQKHFQEACGYAQLGMWDDANTALENVDAFSRAAPEILALRVEIYRSLEKWELMAEIARRLAEFQPNEVQWRVDFAYAVRRCQSVEAAREILLAAESRFPNEAIIKYNLACYSCVLNELDAAKGFLKRCFSIEPRWKIHALDDEDLQPLWNAI